MGARIFSFLLIVLAATIGGAIWRSTPGLGYVRDSQNPAFTANNREHTFLRDEKGRDRLDLGMFNGQPIQDFMSESRQLRLQLGTYTNDVRQNEKGLPVVTLYDGTGRLKELLRLDGRNQSPLVILKDGRQNNRIIMGLGLSDVGEEPFLAYFSNDGRKHLLFGNF